MTKKISEEKVIMAIRSKSLNSRSSLRFKNKTLLRLNEKLEYGRLSKENILNVPIHNTFLFASVAVFFLTIFAFLIMSYRLPTSPNILDVNKPEETILGFKRFSSSDDFKNYLSQGYSRREIENYSGQDFQGIPIEDKEYLRVPIGDSLESESPGDFPTESDSQASPFSDYSAPSQITHPPVRSEGKIISPEKMPLTPDRVSQTNIQVLFVDEPDIVKAHGQYIYSSSQKPNSMETKIIRAYPLRELAKVSQIEKTGSLLIQDNILVILSKQENTMSGYDVSNPSNPWQRWIIQLKYESNFVQARAYNGKIYLITTTEINRDNPCPYQPVITAESPFIIPCDTIYHSDRIVPAESVYTVMVVNPKNGGVEKTMSFVGSSSNSIIYMSTDSLYISYSFKKDESEATQIVKIQLDGLKAIATGEVAGRLLNQFSLDEHNGALRIATTAENSSFPAGRSTNSVYILNKNLDIIGEVTDLGINEKIYSVRFLNNLAYVVTFREIDPFYIIDLSNPTRPQLKGQLKIPGYSSYLHPLSINRILGVGIEAGRVKLSLFDVSDPKNPTEVSKYLLDEYSSDVLSDHHAFLHDPKHSALFIPAIKGGYVFSYVNDQLVLVSVVRLPNVKRAVYLNDYIYVISDDAIVVIDEFNWNEVKRLRL